MFLGWSEPGDGDLGIPGSTEALSSRQKRRPAPQKHSAITPSVGGQHVAEVCKHAHNGFVLIQASLVCCP